MFPSFVNNEADPLMIFSDSIFHKSCFNQHPLAEKALLRLKEFRDCLSPGNRVCIICHQKIQNPDEYLSFPYFTENVNHPLNQYNYAQFHRSCASTWPQLPCIVELLKEIRAAGVYTGNGIDDLIDSLDNLRNKEN